MKTLLIVISIALCNFTMNQLAKAQSTDDFEIKKFEIGGQFTFLRRIDANPSTIIFQRNHPSLLDSGPRAVSEFGIGARFTYNFTRYAAIEIEGNIFPEDKRSNQVAGTPIGVAEPGGRKLQAVAGPKIGYRGKRFGVFGKFRPGLIRLDRYEAVVQVGPPDNFFVLSETRNKVGFLNIDVGGVFEYYRTKRTFLRVDVGDTIIYYRKLPPTELNPSITRHNLQINVGFGFRF